MWCETKEWTTSSGTQAAGFRENNCDMCLHDHHTQRRGIGRMCGGWRVSTDDGRTSEASRGSGSDPL